MSKELEALERKLEIRNRELAEAHSHIAALEEKLLKLKQYRRELKSLKEERRTLRKSPERRIGQVLLAPYRVLEKPAKQFGESFTGRSRTLRGRLLHRANTSNGFSIIARVRRSCSECALRRAVSFRNRSSAY